MPDTDRLVNDIAEDSAESHTSRSSIDAAVLQFRLIGRRHEAGGTSRGRVHFGCEGRSKSAAGSGREVRHLHSALMLPAGAR